MGLRSTLTAILASPLATLLEGRVRELTEEALAARDLAEPAEIRAVSARLEAARAAVDALGRELGALRARVDAFTPPTSSTDDRALRLAGAEARQAEAAGAVEAVQAGMSRLADQVVALRGRVEAVDGRLDAAAAMAGGALAQARAASSRLSPPAPVVAEPEVAPLAPPAATAPAADRGCVVPGCTGAHRARGLCGRHYMTWSRGSLAGVVRADGTVFFEEGGPVYSLGTTHAAKAAVLVDGAPRLA